MDKEWKLLLSQAVSALKNIASLCGEDGDTVSKEELVKAQGGEMNLFEKLDADEDGSVTLAEFEAYLTTVHVAKGNRFIKQMVSLTRNLKSAQACACCVHVCGRGPVLCVIAVVVNRIDQTNSPPPRAPTQIVGPPCQAKSAG